MIDIKNWSGGANMGRKEWQRPFVTGLIIVLLFAGGYGCVNLFSSRTVQEQKPEMKQPILTSYQFEDIPLPPGMTLNRKESFFYETREIKTGLFIYEGRGQMEQLSNFFKQQMPKYQWRLVSNFELHNVMLNFIKEGWSSIIYIIPQQGEKKRIEIRVGPIEIKTLPPLKE
jgi:hypothetical protein